MPHQQTVISEQLINTFFPKQFLATIQSTPDTSEAVSSPTPASTPDTSEAVFSPTPASTIVPHTKLAQKLRTAREKLQLADGPQVLKVLAYLRISCNLMRQMQSTPLQMSSAQDLTLIYSELVKALLAHDRHWWTHCTINSTGCLRSPDAVVDHLLSTIEEFHQIYR